jgi:hypothetical protein
MADIITATLYDRDFYAWLNEQAGSLRAGRLSERDIEILAEEIESMGRSERANSSAASRSSSCIY